MTQARPTREQRKKLAKQVKTLLGHPERPNPRTRLNADAGRLKKDPDQKVWELRGANLEVLHDQSKQILLSGPAGTGKSLAVLLKLHILAESVPGCRLLIVRRTRESLTESALVTFENHVLPPRHPAKYGASRRMRQVYDYPNGSEIIVGGLDKWSKVMSTEYDVIYVQEATEVDLDSWEALTTRLRNRKLSYQQIIGDCNPDKPTHWLKLRCEKGKTKMLQSRHEDNPSLHDGKDWTADGKDYLATLDDLTGHRRNRLRFGLWTQAEGMVYESWDRDLHTCDRFAVPYEWPRYWTVDFGFTNPLVIQWWALAPDGTLYRYRELYRTQLLVEDAARIALAYSGAKDHKWGDREPKPRRVICDHDAEGRETLERHLRMPTWKARKEKSPGIQAVQSRLLKDLETGRPKVMFMRDCQVPPADKNLKLQHKPACTEEEFEGYVWDLDDSRKLGEEPVKKDDHGLDATRYMVAELDVNKKRRLVIA
jgi:phage terminase large subunit